MKRYLGVCLVLAAVLVSTSAAEIDPKLALRLLQVEQERDKLAQQLSEANRRINQLEREISSLRRDMSSVRDELVRVKKFVKMPEPKAPEKEPDQEPEKAILPISVIDLLEKIPQDYRPNRGTAWTDLHAAVANKWLRDNLGPTRVEFSASLETDFSPRDEGDDTVATATVDTTASFKGQVYDVVAEVEFPAKHFNALSKYRRGRTIALAGNVASAQIELRETGLRKDTVLHLKLNNCAPLATNP